MKYREFAAKLAIFTLFLFQGNVQAQISEKAQQFYENGEFNKARNEIKQQLPNNPKLVPGDTEIFLETMNRIEIDFQRGEMEWDGGNLYFDKWDYNMKITNLNKK